MPPRRYRTTLPCLLLATSAAFAASPSDSPALFHQTNILGTSLDLQIVAASPEDVATVHAAVLAEIERLRKILSTYDPTSEISKVNHSLQPVPVSPELLDVLALYDQWSARTHGAFTGNLGSLIALWKNAEATHTPPTPAQLDAEVTALRTPLWRIDPAAHTVQRLADRPINIDSLGKGFIVSRALAAGQAALPSVRGILLNIGGDIAAVGYALPDRQVKWPIAVADPLHPAENAPSLVDIKLSGQSVATSAGYARGYDINGLHLSHILDPRTARPVNLTAAGTPKKWAVTSATVIAPDNATANALATTLCVLTPDEGLALIRSTPDTECLLILADGAKLRSDGFRKFEVPRPNEPRQSLLADSPGPRWPTQYSVDITLQIKAIDGRTAERPYAAVWIEDAQHQHVATLAVWGNDPKWLQEMPGWWKFGRTDPALVQSITRATRPAGKYTFTWNGKDRAGRLMPQGSYRICVEVDYDHGGRVTQSAPILCTATPAAATIDGSDVFEPVSITYGTKEAAR